MRVFFLDVDYAHRLGNLSQMIVQLSPENAMKLPQKNHFSLGEVAERWNAPIADIQYYAIHGMLEVQTWLDAGLPVVRMRHQDRAANNNALAISSLDDCVGYVVVEACELRRIFRSDRINHRISPEALVISREERDRFETTYRIECVAKHADIEPKRMSAVPPISFPGRPSVMRRIVVHFEERCEKKILERSLERESNY